MSLRTLVLVLFIGALAAGQPRADETSVSGGVTVIALNADDDVTATELSASLDLHLELLYGVVSGNTIGGLPGQGGRAGSAIGRVTCRERFGGMLRFHRRAAA